MLLSNLAKPWIAVCVLFGLAPQTYAAEGNPIAIRVWPDGGCTIETFWNLHLGVNVSEDAMAFLPRVPDQMISFNTPSDSMLFRTANEAQPSWQPLSEVKQRDPNAVAVESFPETGGLILVEVDGVRIALVPSIVAEFPLPPIDEVDVLVLGETGPSNVHGMVKELVSKIKPSIVLLNAAPDKSSDVAKFSEALGATLAPIATSHNTFAISSSAKAEGLQIVTVASTAWHMPQPLADLFELMETSCSDSQKVFEKLSTNQMNFQPSNGTHTPRWNTEHMMGRQLLFFSQIYHAQDKRIPVIDLNPKQMPPDYRFAHPDWDGREEARQMERVSSFTRRFAYLLENMDVDKKAPGSSWPTLRALLDQMHRHYSEHTANTVKKFDLPDWPKE